MISSQVDSDLSTGFSLVGVDLSRSSRRRTRGAILPWIISAILAALFIVGLRIDLIRMGYASIAALEQEQVLRQQERALTVEMRLLRNHTRLAAEASQRGFEQPSSVIDLPLAGLPSVAAAVSGGEPRP